MACTKMTAKEYQVFRQLAEQKLQKYDYHIHGKDIVITANADFLQQIGY